MTDFASVRSREPLRLTSPVTERHKRPSAYEAPEGLREAIDVAMLLGEPLLLTGDPGIGKTRAAYWLAEQLFGVGAEPLRHDVKSTTSGVDLLYSFDEVGQFRDASRGQERPLVDYLRFNPLGEAILRAAGGGAVLRTAADQPLKGEVLARSEALLEQAFGKEWAPTDGAARAGSLLPGQPSFATAEPEHCLVLVDELDKAPRDTPNDLLVEVEDMRFLIRELGLAVVAGPEVRPVVMITSNSEKALPEPFLRRCAFFDVPPPSPDTLKKIVDKSVEAYTGGDTIVADAIAVWSLLRDPRTDLRQLPGVSDLLAWLEALNHLASLSPDTALAPWVRGQPERLSATLAPLLKLRDDRRKGEAAIRRWAQA